MELFGANRTKHASVCLWLLRGAIYKYLNTIQYNTIYDGENEDIRNYVKYFFYNFSRNLFSPWVGTEFTYSFIHSFIQSGYFYSASSSPLLPRVLGQNGRGQNGTDKMAPIEFSIN